MDIIKKENKNLYEEYTNIVIEYQNLINESHQTEIKYNYEFGLLEVKKFKAYIDIIKTKKIISLIIAKRNHGNLVDIDNINKEVNEEMITYNLELEQLVNNIKNVSNYNMVSNEDARKVKKIFYKIAKLIHPDLNPSLIDRDDISNLWHRALFFYNNYDLEELEKIYEASEVIVSNSNVEINYLDLEEKILKYKNKMMELRKAKPYSLNEYLVDEAIIYLHKEKLNKDIESYNKYNEELLIEIDTMLRGYENVQ